MAAKLVSPFAVSGWRPRRSKENKLDPREKREEVSRVQMWGNEYRTTMVCIDSYEGKVPKGRLYNQFCPEGIGFYGAIDFLKKMEDMLERMKFPQAYTMVRSFTREEPDRNVSVLRSAQEQTGEYGTLALRVLFRQNSSWQGSVTWVEGRQEESFRSVLELLFLMDSAATAMEQRNDTIRNYKW